MPAPLPSRTGRLLRVIARFLLLAVAVLLLVRAFTIPIDEDGTREITLVRTNGSTFCQSCMGLYK
ncbi:MAG TPA: hypothetical protein P5077_10990 [bacterium]|nr:hypothetical protein [bacterium]